MRVLCTGDLHIGRRSSRLPSRVDPTVLAAATVWGQIVDYAIAQQIDVVALSGDIVDKDNRYYEAVGPLERGLRRLAAAGIPAVAVAGNHDYAVLPELARSLPKGCLQLLGVGGTWERAVITVRDQTLYVDGWSFPAPHVAENPLASHNLSQATDAPVLGLLHSDLDQPASRYAPVLFGDLCAKSVTLWLLGHVHVPRLRADAGKPVVLYPGSPQPLDPGESGAHGAWVVDLTMGQVPAPRMIPVASARYETIEVDVSDAGNLAAVREIIVERIRSAAEGFVRDAGPLQHLSLRVRLVGRCALHRELAGEVKMMESDLDLEVGGVGVYVERVDPLTRPNRDLAALAAGGDAASYLAKLLLAIEHGTVGAEHSELLRNVGAIPAILRAAKPYKKVAFADEEFTPGALHKELAHAAGSLLDELLLQKAGVA